jgi:phenylalanyl-tRNA synthetase alpha chain
MDTSEIERIEREGSAALEGAATLAALRDAESAVLGKRSPLAGVSATLGGLDAEGRRTMGQAVNAARARLQDVAATRRQTLEAEERTARLTAERLDLTEVVAERRRGHLHLVTQTRYRLEDVFTGMGFTIAEGPEVETDWYNFTALNLPPAHPARSTQDSVYLELGEPESTLLRTQTSPVQIRVMESQEPPIYIVAPGRTYRRDTPDARHMPSFSQIEGLVVDRDITFGDLAGTIETFTTAFFGGDIHSRLRPYFFPFTEPSAEYEITCVICRGQGCRTCSNTGWIELGGCGMVHPQVLRNGGIDPEEWSGFAFGFGIDRLAQMFNAVGDMRQMFDNDVRFVRQF